MSPHHSPIRGGPSDAFERRYVATGGQAGFAFVPQQLTSYGGLELLRWYMRRIELPRRLQAACAALGGDYGGGRLALLLLALPYVGARRLEHLPSLLGDPLVCRFAGLARAPSRWSFLPWRTGARCPLGERAVRSRQAQSVTRITGPGNLKC